MRREVNKRFSWMKLLFQRMSCGYLLSRLIFSLTFSSRMLEIFFMLFRAHFLLPPVWKRRTKCMRTMKDLGGDKKDWIFMNTSLPCLYHSLTFLNENLDSNKIFTWFLQKLIFKTRYKKWTNFIIKWNLIISWLGYQLGIFLVP